MTMQISADERQQRAVVIIEAGCPIADDPDGNYICLYCGATCPEETLASGAVLSNNDAIAHGLDCPWPLFVDAFSAKVTT